MLHKLLIFVSFIAVASATLHSASLWKKAVKSYEPLNSDLDEVFSFDAHSISEPGAFALDGWTDVLNNDAHL